MSGFGYATRINNNRHAKQIHRALTTGYSVHKATNTQVTFKGTYREVWGFRGPIRYVTGSLVCRHFETDVLSANFDEDRITDFGYSGYSKTTTRNITAWLAALEQLRPCGVQSLTSYVTMPLHWTRDKYRQERGAGYHEDMWQRFRAGVPWVKNINSVWWFYGPGWSGVLLDQYQDSRRDVLANQDFHWFTYDWDENGHWSKRFIDAAARKRYEARQRRSHERQWIHS